MAPHKQDYSYPRDIYFDNIKFVLIVLVVAAHAMRTVTGPVIYHLYKLIYLFHMPCFIFIAGYFSQNRLLFQPTNAQPIKRKILQSIKEIVANKNFINLIFTYIWFQLFYCFFLKKYELSFIIKQPLWVMWFILALIAWKITLPLTTRIKHPIFVSTIAGILVGYIPSIGYDFSLSRIFVFYPFFLMGYYTPKELLLKCKKLNLFIPIFLFIISFLIIFNTTIPRELLYGAVGYSNLGFNSALAGFYRLGIYIWTFILSVSFFALIPTYKTWFSHMGERTMQIYLLHSFIIKYLFIKKIRPYNDEPYQAVLFYAFLVLLTILLSSNFISRLISPFTDVQTFKNIITGRFLHRKTRINKS